MGKSGIVASGFYVPENIITNRFFLESKNNPYRVYVGQDNYGYPLYKEDRKKIENEEKILEMTGGIKERRRVSEKETIVDMVEKAFINSKFPAEELSGIIIGTISDDIRFPSVACRVQDRIKAKNVSYAEDVVAACSGFTHALEHARLRVKENGGYYLVVRVEILTRMTDYTELNCDLFGDGCGLIVIGQTKDESDIIGMEFASDTTGLNFIYRDNDGFLRMPAGPKVFEKATRGMIDLTHKLIKNNGIEESEISKYIPHQANGRIIDKIEEKIDPDKKGKVYRNIERYGNMSAATVPVAFAEACQKKEINKGDLVIVVDVGSGLVFGSGLIRV